MASGRIFAKACLRAGYFPVGFVEYPSLIRGGHNTYTIRVAPEKIFSPRKPVDLLVALNENAALFHLKALSSHGEVIVNTDKVRSSSIRRLKAKKVSVSPMPLVALAKKAGGQEVMQNMVALGAAFYLLGGELRILEGVIKEMFGKGAKAKMALLNIKAARQGFEYAKKNFQRSTRFSLRPRKQSEDLLLLSGNEAICLGAVAAGCKFFVSYPMTPMNALIRFFAQKGPDLGIVYKQPEDEIAAINMALGASLAGVRAMTATSGGGFSLMVEAYGLAGMTETPLVIAMGQRPGPATGLPTWGGQGDLRFMLHAAQDEFPRIVLAPGDPKECFSLTAQAFNLAEKYQTPVVVLTDTHLAESIFWAEGMGEPGFTRVEIDRGQLLTESVQKKGYKRYQLTRSGVSPRALPGREGPTFIANSDEHNEEGFSEESARNRVLMMGKRLRKLKTCQQEIPHPKIYGPRRAKITLVSWGSNKGAILDAQRILKDEGVETKFLHLNYLNPLPQKFLERFFKQEEKNLTLMIEKNPGSQLGGLLREKTGFVPKDYFLKYDGRLIFPEEIVAKVKKSLKI